MKSAQLKVLDAKYPDIIGFIKNGELKEGEEVIIIDHSNKEEFYGKYIGVVHVLNNCYEIRNTNNANCWYSEVWR
jgi:nanoRNase/pAp phosphatase (c-di-AMP/oligoRNAs hydrolase)